MSTILNHNISVENGFDYSTKSEPIMRINQKESELIYEFKLLI